MKNIIDKIWDAHVVVQEPQYPAILAIDLMLLHEVTSAQAFRELEDRNLGVFDAKRLIATLDHSIPTRQDRRNFTDPQAEKQVEHLRRNCQKHGIPIFDYDSGRQGIVHVIGPELGLTQPGMTLVCGDSHTSTHGALGAFAFGVGTSEVAHVLATGCLLAQKPKTMKVEFVGSFQKGVFAKDVILHFIGEIGMDGATGYALEYAGETVSRMSMEERMTVCNMSIECGARAGIISPDETTFSYLKGKPFAPPGDLFDDAVKRWRLLASDENASYDHCRTLDLHQLEPMITWGTNPEQVIPISATIPFVKNLNPRKQEYARKSLDYVQLTEGKPILGVSIDWAFIGSCTNGRIEDLRIAAKILRNKKVHKNVTLLIVPGSEGVLLQLKQEGLDRIFEQSGAQLRMPGCSLCLGMNDDRVPPGKRCLSTSNRNFVGRQGPGSLTHLASPATVAASTIAGCIADPREHL